MDKFIDDLVDFHMEWSGLNVSSNNVDCFTIREIASTIKALSLAEISNSGILKSGYKIIETIYGARYPNSKRKELENTLNRYKNLKNLDKTQFQIPKEIKPRYFHNESIQYVIGSIIFSLKMDIMC